MATLALTRLRLGGRNLRELLLPVSLALWAVMTFGEAAGLHVVPFARGFILLVPLILLVAAIRTRNPTGELAIAAGFAWTVILAITLVPMADSRPKLALAFPAALIAGLIAHRWPAWCMIGIVFISGSYGTLDAYTGYHNTTIADALICGLWVAALGQVLFGRREHALKLTAGLLMICAYFAMTLIAVLAIPPIDTGIRGFRLSALHLSVAIVIGFVGWRPQTLVRAGHATAAICTLVGAYATLRYFIGPSGKERDITHISSYFVQYNQVFAGEDKLQGSFPNGQQLGVWMACAIPFLTAMALSWRGRWRLVALAGLPLSFVGLLGSSQRTGFAAAIAGCLTIVVARMISRGFRGPRFAIALASVMGFVIGASVIFPAIVDRPEERVRYENILTPSRDKPFQARVQKWRSVLDELRDKPFGYGVGTGNAEAIPHRFMDIASYNIDNSYLMIAYGQGITIAVFFTVALLILLAELLHHAVWARGPTGTAYATAGAGVLVAILVEMVGAKHIESSAIMGGWVMVGLGLAQYGIRRRDGEVSDPAVG